MIQGRKMAYNIERKNDVIYIAIEDRLEIEESEILENEINQRIDQGDLYLVINFAHATYLSSLFLRALIRLIEKLNTEKGILVLSSLSDNIKRIFSIMEIDKLFVIKKTDEESFLYINETV